jgi:hypothetical protein
VYNTVYTVGIANHNYPKLRSFTVYKATKCGEFLLTALYRMHHINAHSTGCLDLHDLATRYMLDVQGCQAVSSAAAANHRLVTYNVERGLKCLWRHGLVGEKATGWRITEKGKKYVVDNQLPQSQGMTWEEIIAF